MKEVMKNMPIYLVSDKTNAYASALSPFPGIKGDSLVPD